jgi:hypothetical protein
MRAFDLAVMAGLLGLGSAAMAGTLSLDRGVISAGGGESLATGYGLSGTIGQPVAHSASTSAGPLVARAGFWTQVLRWVNAVPVASEDQVIRLATSTTAKIQISTLLGNDSDADQDALSILAVGEATPAGASVRLQGNFVVYTVPGPSVGNGGFTYTLSDGIGTSIGTVAVTAEGLDGGGPANPNTARIELGNNGYVLRFVGVPSRQYRIQYTTDVTPPRVWRDFNPSVIRTAPANGVFGHVDVNPPDPSRFYRAISQP